MVAAVGRNGQVGGFGGQDEKAESRGTPRLSGFSESSAGSSTSHKEGYSHFIAARRSCQSPAWVFRTNQVAGAV